MKISVVLSNDKTFSQVTLTYEIDLDVKLTLTELNSFVEEDCKKLHITDYFIEELIFGE